MRLLSLALALGLVSPQKATARVRNRAGAEPRLIPPTKQSRRRVERRTGLLELAPQRSPCGRHLVEVEAGAVYLDGQRIHPLSGTVHVLGAPSWRADGAAVAWLERRSGETRLVVIPMVAPLGEVIVWPLPKALGNDRLHWASDNKIVIGPEPLQPRAVASWSE